MGSGECRGNDCECRSNDYGSASYWDARYSIGAPASGGGGGEFYDWYQTYPALRPLFRARVPASSRVLMLGCGNSRTSVPLQLHLHAAVICILVICNVATAAFAMLCGRARTCSLSCLQCSVQTPK